EVDPSVVEAVPSISLCFLAVATQILLVAVPVEVMFARHVEHFAGLHLLKKFRHSVELARLGKVREVSGVEDEGRGFGKGVDASDRLPERAGDILVGVSGKPEVAVADLNERKGWSARLR